MGSAKVEYVADRLDEIVPLGHRALIFSQFTSFLARIRVVLERRGVSVVQLDGSTRNREEVVERFRSGEAQVFLISLKAGGSGLTLTEAQQFGAVPVAFDSYASLREIITDGENGRYVPFADVSAYAKAVLELMEDAGMRQEMALYAIESSKRFSWGAIAEKWQALLEELGSL